MTKIRRALISVSDKTGIIEFARELAKLGIGIISTGGTAKALRDANIPVTDISDYTGFPEILDGRLKTLHPKIHGGILGIRENANHAQEMKKNGIEPIDLVIVNLYPFEKTVARPDASFEDAIENIDIGGPTMLRAAAKNHHDVAVVCDPSDYDGIIKELQENSGALKDHTKFRLAQKVFANTARYDAAIATHLNKFDEKKNRLDLPSVIGFTFEKMFDLRYGENPHQKAAFYCDTVKTTEPSVANARQLHGKELSYNNIMDADATIEMVSEFTNMPYAAVIVKHTNPCGVAVSNTSLADAFSKALACDPVSAFGGIIGVNGPLDEVTAQAISESFYEVIVAPSFSPKAQDILKKKKNIRLLEVAGLGSPPHPIPPPQGGRVWEGGQLSLRKVVGGLLLQQRDTSREDVRISKVVTKRGPTEEEWTALEFAWRVCKHVKSNAIVYAASDKTLGIGAGQMSRVDSSRIAVMKAQSSLKGSVIASDAFFPFRDGIDAAAEAGATAIVQPGGSIRDDEVIAAADEQNLAMVFTGVRHFKH
jgi:phosphoribosylaminoimidazolecarboxamide formyltransferase/IMP cyclohydrolase